MSWPALASRDPELAAFGAARLHDQVAYLATVKPDGAPRLHPVRPVIAADRLFLFMQPASPKGLDLRRDGRYVLHCTATGRQLWDLHEFYVEGTAHVADDPAVRQIANAGSDFPRDERFGLFELGVASAFSTVYGQDGRPIRQHWRSPSRAPFTESSTGSGG